MELLEAFTKEAQSDGWYLSLACALLAYRATVYASTAESPFKMFKGREMRVLSDTFLPSKEAATDIAPENVLHLVEGVKKPFNIARRCLKMSYSG